MVSIEFIEGLGAILEANGVIVGRYLRKFRALDRFDKIQLLKALPKIIEKHVETYVDVVNGIVEKPKSPMKAVDPVVPDNSDFLICGSMDENETENRCICGGGQCVENPPYPCTTQGKTFDEKYVCDTDYYFVVHPRLCISEGQPWASRWTCNAPKYVIEPQNNVMYAITHITAPWTTTIRSIVLGCYVKTEYTKTCCSSCPSGAVDAGDIPAFYWPYEVEVQGGAPYTILVQFKAV